MRVLMFGWEFPPFNSGGLGVACENLAKALSGQNIQITFVLPKKMNCQSSFCKIIFADSNLEIKAVNSLISSPYITSSAYKKLYGDIKTKHLYSPDLFGEVARYGQQAKKIALTEKFDIIHAHDWLSYPAGITAKEATGKPLILHIHATEFDRTGGNNLNEHVYQIEKLGFEKADAIIAVSNFTRNRVIQHYGISPDKVITVHNAINYDECQTPQADTQPLKADNKKIVLFVGRITLQKGPDYFLAAAKKVLEQRPDVLFVVAGSGDMELKLIEGAAYLNIAENFLFAGFLRGDQLAQAYKMADLYVMPSVSEPFGLTPLESMVYGTPVLISRQSGVSEILSHALKVDFWDIDEMANKIIAVLDHPELYQTLKENGQNEVKKLNWSNAAKKCIDLYHWILAKQI